MIVEKMDGLEGVANFLPIFSHCPLSAYFAQGENGARMPPAEDTMPVFELPIPGPVDQLHPDLEKSAL
jgi:hypothetical protein